MSEALIAPSYAEIARMHRHFRLLNGSPEALEFLLAPTITGAQLETWLQTPANLSAFQAVVNSPIAGAIVNNKISMAAIVGSETAASLCRSSQYSNLFGDAVIGRTLGLMMLSGGGGAGTWTRIDGGFNAIANPGAAYFNNHPTFAGIATQTIDGQQMVRIPKFWFRAGTVPSGPNEGKTYWQISDQPVAGFSVHPAFIGPDGTEYGQIWVGKYQAGYDGTSKATSVAGVAPMVSMDFPTARQRAYARNTGGVSGFRLWSAYDLSAIQMLASIEMGGLDMQSLIGQGRVNQSSAANVDASDVAQATWRGIVGLWGNVWQMLDGLKTNNGQLFRWSVNAPGNTTANDFSTGYTAVSGATIPGTGGWPTGLDAARLAQGIFWYTGLQSTQSNGSTGDYCWIYQTSSDYIAYHGGAWGDGAPAGLFSLAVYSAPSSSYSTLGCRLAKV